MDRSTSVLALLLAISCGSANAPPRVTGSSTRSPPTASGHSIDLAAMDRSVKPGDDFFLYANGAWYAKAEIPADRGSDRRRAAPDRGDREAHQGPARRGGCAPRRRRIATQKIGDYYAALPRRGGHRGAGARAAAKELAAHRARSPTSTRSPPQLGAQLRADVDPLNTTNFHTDRVLGLWVEQDLNDPVALRAVPAAGRPRACPTAATTSTTRRRMAALRAKYVQHLAAMLQLAGIDEPGRQGRAHLRAREEDRRGARDPRRLRGRRQGQQPVGARGLRAKRARACDWDAFFKAAALDEQPSFIVWHPQRGDAGSRRSSRASRSRRGRTT